MRGGQVSRALDYQSRGLKFESQSTPKSFSAPCVNPALNVKLGLFRLGENKGVEESNGKVPHNAVCQEQSGSYS